jgi:hypothetical protein
MPFGFDPRKLIDEDKKNKKEEEKKAWHEQEEIDKAQEEHENTLRRKSNIKDAFDSTFQAVREYKYLKKHGKEEYHKAKKLQDPDYEPQSFSEWAKENKGILQGTTMDWKTGDNIWPEDLNENQKRLLGKTLETEYGDRPVKEHVQFASMTGSGDNKKIDNWWESDGETPDPFESEIGITESVTGAVVSGLIKIPYGWANLTAMIADWAGEEGIPVDQMKVAQLENWFDKTFFGQVMAYGEDKAHETAIGHITEFMIQMIGSWKIVGNKAMKVTDSASRITNRAIDAIKNGKYTRTAGNSNAYATAKKAMELNKLSNKQKFVSLLIGGGVSGALVYDTESIGTFGDWFFDKGEYTALDRERRGTAKEDATRMLYNKLKFGGEMGFPIIPTVIGLGKVGKLILNNGKNLAYSSSKLERYIDKYFASKLRARGKLPEEEFQAMQRLHGKEASAQSLATDYLRNFDQIIKRMSKYTQKGSNATGLTDDLSNLIVDTIKEGKLGVKNGRVVVKGFDSKSINKFYETLTKKLNIPEQHALRLIDELSNVHGSWAEFLNNVTKGGNLNVTVKEFVDLMNARIRNSLSSQYKIFKENSLRPIDEYAVASDIRDEVADIFMRNAIANDAKMTKTEARLSVDAIIKNVRLDPATSSPVFKFEAKGWAKDKALMTKNIAENVTGGGKFKPDKKGGLIQTENDLKAFKKLFGSYENANTIIANVTTDLASIASRDRFYNKMKFDSDAMVKRGERALVYPSYNEAFKAFNTIKSGKKIVETPLRLPQGIAEEAYTVPLNGMFTTEEIAHGLKYGANATINKKTMPLWYQIAVLIPKGLVQAGKTVLGPFTHGRNFASGAVTTIATGNIFINPLQMAKAFRTAYRTIQPQLLGRNRPGFKVASDTSVPGRFRPGANTVDPDKLIPASEFTTEGGQSLYRFLLDEGMVNASATYRDLMGLIEDTQRSGFFQWVGKKMDKNFITRGAKKFMKTAQDLYVAEDDFWKIWNFAAESHRIRRAYKNALSAGKITMKQVPGGNLESVEILKMATQNVREMLPNYAYVSDLIKGMRRAPIGNFVSWPSEIIRGSSNMTLKALQETKDPVLARMGWERLMGMTVAWGTLAPLSVWGFQQAYGFTQEKLNALKEFVPWFSKDSTILPVYVDGKYKYIDFSRGYFYDTIVNPVQSIINAVEQNKDQPLIPRLIDGFGRASARLVEPFISEAIWVGGIADIFMRGGVSKQGTRVFNELDDFGIKMQKSIVYLAKTMSPGSQVQVRRLYAAIMDKTLKGVQYEVPDELLGFIGARPAPIDVKKQMHFFINEFILQNERLTSRMLYEGLRTGDPVDPNDIIKKFIYGNRIKFQEYSKMRRKIDAAKLLGYSDEELRVWFDKRNQLKDYEMITENTFKPFKVTEGAKESFQSLAEEHGIRNPLDERTLEILGNIYEIMADTPLNSDWTLDAEDWIQPDQGITIDKGTMSDEPWWKETKAPTPPLGPTPEPSKLLSQKPQVDPITNLTGTETAVLSPTEKVIAGRT